MAICINGYLLGYICSQYSIFDRISEAKIYALPASRSDAIGASFSNRETKRDSVQSISEEALTKIVNSSSGLLTAVSDAQGQFCLESKSYKGGELDVYVCVQSVPLPGATPEQVDLEKQECLYLGAFLPIQFNDQWYFGSIISESIWCEIKRAADAWTIVGKVTTCEGNIPLSGVEVTAFDVDFTQHDTLGNGLTNTNGVFRVDYPGSVFREGTFLNIELFGGPDAYFSIDDQDGNSLLIESPSRGRNSDRKNIGPCFCVNLCADVAVVPPGALDPAWTSVGNSFTIPDASSLQDFNAAGYVGSNIGTGSGNLEYALTSSIRFTGQADIQTGAGNPVEYRFLITDLNDVADNGTSSLPVSQFNTVIGKAPNENLFASTLVGRMVRFLPSYKIVEVYAIQNDLDVDGWLDVNTSIFRTFLTEPGLTPAEIGDFGWIDQDGLMALNTQNVTQADNVNTSTVTVGLDVPGAEKIALEKIGVRFEIREVINKAANLFNALPGDGTTVNSMVINNNPAVLTLGIKEQIDSGNLCGILEGDVHAVYTAYHPHIEDVRISVVNNSGSYNVALNEVVTGVDGVLLPLVNNSSAAIASLHSGTAGFQLPDTNTPANHELTTCSYIATLAVKRRLHTGDSNVATNYDQVSFYYQD